MQDHWKITTEDGREYFCADFRDGSHGGDFGWITLTRRPHGYRRYWAPKFTVEWIGPDPSSPRSLEASGATP